MTTATIEARLPANIGPPATGTPRIMLLGCGTVGQGFADILKGANARHSGAPVITQILVRDRMKVRQGIDPSIITNDIGQLDLDNIDVVIEALGGVEPAYSLVKRALNAGRHVVTANKVLLATHGPELLELAESRGLAFRFEAAVGAVTPIIRVLGDTLQGVSVERIFGVLNGTSHFVLSEWLRSGTGLSGALASAKEQGFAEADPSSDLSGDDAACKIAVLCWVLTEQLPKQEQIHRVALPTLQPETLIAVSQLGFCIKPVACLSWTDSGEPHIWVAPAAVGLDSPIAATKGVESSLVIQSPEVGDIFLSGRGAGSLPTASAIFDDLTSICNQRQSLCRRVTHSRLAAGAAGKPRDWIVHVPEEAELDKLDVSAHLRRFDGNLRQYRSLDVHGFVMHASGIAWSAEFTGWLTSRGACVLEVVTS